MRSNLVLKRDYGNGLDIEVVDRKDTPGAWSVEAIDNEGDGSIFQAIFIGPDAQERAKEYAQLKYGVRT
jgi:hypothetical protein